MPRLSFTKRPKLVTALIETFGFSPLLATGVALLLLVLASAAIVWVVLAAPPSTITITAGPPGSSFYRYAEAYRAELAKEGVTLRILESGGSMENLDRLQRSTDIDLGFVQGGSVGDTVPPHLVSLGTLSYQPLWVFYRGAGRISRLSELGGRRLGIGAPGSGVHRLARALLESNGIAAAPTVIVEQPSEEAGREFQAGRLDAIFLMGDSASIQMLRTLMRAEGVQLYSFTQADAYVRRMDYLHKIVLPQGSIDFGRNLPADDVVLVGPGVELVARRGFNSAVSDLVVAAAQVVHGRAGLLARRGDFPVPLEGKIPLSEDARRYYKSGRGFTYKVVGSFWVASLINRLLVAILPIVLVLIPAIRLVPVLYRWSVQLRIYRCYRPLLQLERDAAEPVDPARAPELLARLDEIEQRVNELKVPASFASQFYDLRYHVRFVRRRLDAAGAGAAKI